MRELLFGSFFVREPAEFRRLSVENPVAKREFELLRERHQILYQMILDVREEIDSLRERINLLCESFGASVRDLIVSLAWS